MVRILIFASLLVFLNFVGCTKFDRRIAEAEAVLAEVKAGIKQEDLEMRAEFRKSVKSLFEKYETCLEEKKGNPEINCEGYGNALKIFKFSP